MESEHRILDPLVDAWRIFISKLYKITEDKETNLSTYMLSLSSTLKDVMCPGIDISTVNKFIVKAKEDLPDAHKLIQISNLIQKLHDQMDEKFIELATKRDIKLIEGEDNSDVNPNNTTYINQRISDMADNRKKREIFIFYFRLLLLRYVGGLYVLPINFIEILTEKVYDDELTRLFNVPNGFHDTELFGGFKPKTPNFINQEDENPLILLYTALKASVKNMDFLVEYIYRQKLAGRAYKKAVDISDRLRKEAIVLGSAKWEWMNDDFDIIRRIIEIENRKEREFFFSLLTQQFPRNAEQFTESNKAVKDYFSHVYNYYNKFKKVPEDTFEFINSSDMKAMAKYFKVKNYLRDSIMELEI